MLPTSNHSAAINANIDHIPYQKEILLITSIAQAKAYEPTI